MSGALNVQVVDELRTILHAILSKCDLHVPESFLARPVQLLQWISTRKRNKASRQGQGQGSQWRIRSDVDCEAVLPDVPGR